MVKPGTRLGCPQCPTEVVVVRAGSDDVALTCEAMALVDVGGDRPLQGHPDASGEGSLLGKRYVDESADIELLCTKAGPGALACDGRPLTLRSAKPLPSSD